jgi:hypothetical protein
MKATLAILVAVTLAGCAAQETQVARADCKIAPVTTRSAVNKAGPVSELDRRWAEAQLRSSDFRRNELARDQFNTVESALRDCN